MDSLRSRSSLFGVYMLHNDKEMMEIKITDFGSSTYNDNELPVYAGTFPFMAPEVTNK